MAAGMLTRLFGIMIISAGLLAASCGESVEVDMSQSEPEKESVSPAPEPETAEEQAPEVKLMSWDSPPPMIIDTSKKYTAIIVTEKGNLVLELFARDVPRTVNNFVFLAQEGYYDGTTFHRVLPGFMAQGGDQTGTGMGGPGYIFDNEITEHKHVTGALSMANAGANTNGSQFFICYTPQPALDGGYSVFGQLIDGMDVLENITPRDPGLNPQFEGDKIIRVVIEVSTEES